ncbi:MAG: hypothetical protein ACI8PZ_001277 [Myxococcota bacterium]|jgi:hypothetical protein
MSGWVLLAALGCTTAGSPPGSKADSATPDPAPTLTDTETPTAGTGTSPDTASTAPGDTADTADTGVIPTTPGLTGGCTVPLDAPMAARCSFDVSPPQALALTWSTAHHPTVRAVRSEPAAHHEVEVGMLTSDSIWSWSAAGDADPGLALAGEVTTGNEPDHPNWVLLEGTPVNGFVATTNSCRDAGAWTTVWDTYSGTPALAVRVGDAQPESLQFTDHGTLLTMGADRLWEHSLAGALLAEVPIGYDALGVTTHHDAATDGEHFYILYNNLVGETFGDTTIADGFLVLDRSGAEVARWFIGDHVEVPDAPGDWSHANALVLVDDGDALITFRYLNAVARVRVDPAAPDFGAVHYWLNGASAPELSDVPSDFVLVGAGGERETFEWQHDANLLPDGRLTLFDNRRTGPALSRVIDIRLDPLRGEAVVEQAWPLDAFCTFQGGARRAASGARIATCGSVRKIYGFDPAIPDTHAWTMRVTCAAPDGYIPRAVPIDL